MAKTFLDISGLTHLVELIKTSLSGKVDKEIGKSLSSNDFTDENQSKLDNIEPLAEVNKIASISLNGSTLTISDKTVDLTPTIDDVSNLQEVLDNKLNTDGSYTSIGTDTEGVVLIGTSTNFHVEEQGKAKSVLVQHNVDTTAHANIQQKLNKTLNELSSTGTTITFTRVDGSSGNIEIQDTTYSEATTSSSGLLSSADKTKLDSVAYNANNYSLPIANSSTLGGVKIGSNLQIDQGLLSVKMFTTTGTSELGTMTQKSISESCVLNADIETFTDAEIDSLFS